MTEHDLPESHPRHDSLLTRHRIEAGVEQGLTSKQGLIAEGRGEAFDYLLGEETIPSAAAAERVAAAYLLSADAPVLSVNGNVAALVPDEVVTLAETVDATLEVNLFNRTPERVSSIIKHLEAHGATNVLGADPTAHIPGLEHDRGKVAADGIATADVVVVPLEDGDRANALAEAGKTEIVIDLNPLSRSAQAAAVPIIDNIMRAIPAITAAAHDLLSTSNEMCSYLIEDFDPEQARHDAERRIRNGVSS
ncbi:MAG: uncharacterized protein conserved in archaea [Haloquadratum sp. J07HQX50]|nr:MAG: uncharacterized protein conserved in archaea [Haloquadratum sp. J07HQX50]